MKYDSRVVLWKDNNQTCLNELYMRILWKRIKIIIYLYRVLIYWWCIFENERIDSKEIKINNKVRITNKNVGRGLLSYRQMKLH